METLKNGIKWIGACSDGLKVSGLAKNGIVFYKGISDLTPPTIEILSTSLGSQGHYRLLNIKITDDVNIENVKINNQILSKTGNSVEILDGVDFNFEDGSTTIEATDTSGNTSSKTVIVDKTAPVIDLTNIPNTFEIGVDIYTYPEPGIATDNLDGNVNFSSVNMMWFKANSDGSIGEQVAPFEWNTTLSNREPGDYIITYNVSDKAGNTGYNQRTITLYKTPRYSVLRLTRIVPSIGQYAKNGDTIRVILQFEEDLSVVPTIELGNKNVIETMGWDVNMSSYTYNYKIQDGVLPEGELQIKIYGYKDMSGNEGRILTNSDINHATQNKIMIDNTLPQIAGVEDNKVYTIAVTPVVTDLAIDTIKLNSDTFENGTTISENGQYTLIATDKAGNTLEVNFEINSNGE